MSLSATEESTVPGGSRRRVLWSVVAAAFVGATVLVGLVASDPSSPESRAPEPVGAAPPFRLPSLRDPSTELALSDFRGRPVVVNFWASWCVPCRKEMPAFQAVSRELEGLVTFVGVNHRDARSDALAFARRAGVRYPLAYDPDGNTATDYGLFGIPTTVFIDAQGRELERDTGELSEEQLRETITRLFPRAMKQRNSGN